MKNLYIRILIWICILTGAVAETSAQCPVVGGPWTQSQLNWDYLDFLPNLGVPATTYYTPFYISGITPYTQTFAMGPRRVTFTMAPSGNIGMDGENATNTADAGSFATAGHDVQFTTSNAANTTITMTFDAEVANVQFSLFDLDNNQRVNIAAVNTLSLPQVATLTKANAGGAIAILLQQATGPGTNYADNNNFGTLNVSIPGPVKTITITLSNATGDLWLSDINACVTGAYVNNWRSISQPFAGMPSYILTVMDSAFYILDPATGKAQHLYTDPGNEFINGMAYDPYNRLLYYTYTQTGLATRTIYKYDINTEIRTTWVNDVNAAPLNIPTYTQGVESAAASFYDGYYYFGVEGTKTTNPGANMTGRENTIWRIELDASQNPVRAAQVYSTRVDSTIGGSPRFIHDWSDIGVTNNGMMYDFDGAPNNPNWYHFDMMTGQRASYAAPLTGFNFPRQVAVDWQENVYNMGNVGNSPSDGFIVPYNYNGTVNGALNKVVTLKGVNMNGNFGDCSEAFRPLCDFGDAPASYDPNPLSPAVNEKDSALRIGATFDREWNKTSSALANADGSDEDGIGTVPFMAPINGGYNARVNVYNHTGFNARLIAWLDYNGNGVFNAGEAVPTITVPSNTTMQQFTLYWPTTPNTFTNGQSTYLRVRLTVDSSGMTSANATGYYNNGETEDYRVMIDNYPLTVNLLSFNAKVIADDNVKLDWATSGEENLLGYEIQRSTDNINWNTLSTVFATANGSRETSNYTFSDVHPVKGRSFYRLKLTDNNGKYRNSEIRTITINDDVQEITLYPNPAIDKAVLSVNSSVIATGTITITDINGRDFYHKTVQIRKGLNNLDLPAENAESGVYTIRLIINDKIFTKKLIVSK
jgi:hypothetical protein